MNTDRATVERVAESLDWLDLSIFAADTVRHATALLRALLAEVERLNVWASDSHVTELEARITTLLDERQLAAAIAVRAFAEEYDRLLAGGPTVGHYVTATEFAQRWCQPNVEVSALLAERDEARALAKRWRDVYEWDAIEDPLPTYNFPWQEKP